MSDEHSATPDDPHHIEEMQDALGTDPPHPGGLHVEDFGGHPKGLWVLFVTEMWERFSYYGMRALLVLYLITSTAEYLPVEPSQDASTNEAAATSAEGSAGAEAGETEQKPNTNPGFGWTEKSAYVLYGIYTWAVYLTPLFGGWLADRFLGTHRSMLIGGWIIAAGHITLAFTEFFGISAGEAVTLQTGPGALLCFVGGLVLIVIGTGFFKPCVSVMVGQLYGKDDPRKDSGFTIFYMGINLGALFSPLVAGTLGEKVGWHWGFGSAAVGMIAGLIFYQVFRPRYLANVGLPPSQAPPEKTEADSGDPDDPELSSSKSLTKVEWDRIGVILILAFLGNIIFWTAFEQAGSSLNVFALKNTDRTMGGMISGDGFPASWYQSANPFAILVFAPVFAWLWVKLDRLKMNPSTPMKFALGSYLLGIAFMAMVVAAFSAQGGGKAGAHWLLITYVVYTWGELCLSPVGLSMITKLAPHHLQSLMMGVWFLSFSIANLLGGLVAAFSKRLESGELTFIFPGLPGFFLLLVIFPIGAAVLLTILTPKLKRMMHGIH